MKKEEIENKIKELKSQINQKRHERGTAINEGGGWHDNMAVDSINQDIYLLESMIRELSEQFLNIKD